MKNWDEINQDVESTGNLRTVTMEELREAHGAGKLGSTICAEISKKLAGMGLGHIPIVLPRYQHEPVRRYKRGTPAGQLIETVLEPGEQNDRKLVGQVAETKTEYAAIVEQIRELVMD